MQNSKTATSSKPNAVNIGENVVEDTSTAPGRTMRVLVVDDDAEIAGLVRDILRERFQIATVTVCLNGKMAAWEIDRAVQTGRPFHLVISDWNMPNMTGIELLRTVRNQPATARLPFVLLTACSEKNHVLDAAALGVTAYVTKPLSEDILVRKVRDLFAT